MTWWSTRASSTPTALAISWSCDHVSRKHLHRYLSEFDFRYNARDVSDAERAILAIEGTDGKRLTYRDSSS